MTQLQNHNFTSPLRYPGGKGIITNFIKLVMTQNNLIDGDYVEIYAGGASIAMSLLLQKYVRNVHINDVSRPIMAFWNAILDYTDDFCKLIQDTPITIDEWRKQKAVLSDWGQQSVLALGFSTFFLNRTNRSGILRGGVIGGKSQLSSWSIDCRFHKADLIRRILSIARHKGSIHTYNMDASQFIVSTLPSIKERSLVYLDPPYFKKGQHLYDNYYNYSDHVEIAHLVSRNIYQPWIVSYDAAPEIIELYKEFQSLRYHINYSAQDRYAGPELMFFSHHLKVPMTPMPIAGKQPIHQIPLL